MDRELCSTLYGFFFPHGDLRDVLQGLSPLPPQVYKCKVSIDQRVVEDNYGSMSKEVFLQLLEECLLKATTTIH